jgi:hypothetical protein
VPETTPSAVDALLLEPEIVGAVHDEPVQLHEAPFVEQQIEPLAAPTACPSVLRLQPRGPSA